MRMTWSLRKQLWRAISGEWDSQGDHEEGDRWRDNLAEVPDGFDFSTIPEDEWDGDEQPVTPAAKVWETITFFGFENVAGDWH